MDEKRFEYIDIGYGDGWYITDNGERLSEMEIVDLLNEQEQKIRILREEIQSTVYILKMQTRKLEGY